MAPGRRQTRVVALALLPLLQGDALPSAEPPANPALVTIPEPPEQARPWDPPKTNLPGIVVSAFAALFDAGLADPRGCEYREIVVTVQGHSAPGGRLETRGWILPPKPDDAARYAVCWNGLVYPILSLGPAADCRADIQQLLKADGQYVDKELAKHQEREEQRAKDRVLRGEKPWPSPPMLRARRYHFEDDSLSHGSMLRLKAVLLLRLGHADLAEQLWAQWHATEGMRSTEDPFLELAWEWTRALYQRAVSAHCLADDSVALHSLRLLSRAQQSVDVEADKRGFRRQKWGVERSHLYGLVADVPRLLADQERRAKEGPRERVVPPYAPTWSVDITTGVGAQALPDIDRQKYPDAGKRIAALVCELDQVTCSPNGFEDPVVLALVAEGEAAIEPLIECLENDNRMARSLVPQMRVVECQQVQPVYECAHRALSTILHADFRMEMWSDLRQRAGPGFNPSEKEQRAWLAARIRKEAGKSKGVPLAPRTP